MNSILLTVDFFAADSYSLCVYNWQHLEKNVGVESDHLLTSLVAIGHLAQLYPSLFAQSTHNIVSRFVVKELMMQVRVRSTL